MYASPTERAPPVWEKPPEALASETKLQVITRAHPNSKKKSHKIQKRIQGRNEIKNNNRKKVDIRHNNIGKRRGGGYDVKVFDTRNKQNSYSIQDGFIDTEKIPSHLVDDVVVDGNKKFDMSKRKNGSYRQNIHSENSNVSFGDTDSPTTATFRHRHLGKGRTRSHSSTTLATHQFNKRNHHRNKLEYNDLENRSRIRNRG